MNIRLPNHPVPDGKFVCSLPWGFSKRVLRWRCRSPPCLLISHWEMGDDGLKPLFEEAFIEIKLIWWGFSGKYWFFMISKKALLAAAMGVINVEELTGLKTAQLFRSLWGVQLHTAWTTIPSISACSFHRLKSRYAAHQKSPYGLGFFEDSSHFVVFKNLVWPYVDIQVLFHGWLKLLCL